MAQNCNSADASAQASLNGHLLSPNAYLNLGPADCACTSNPFYDPVIIDAADLQTGAYNTLGTNTITFSSYEAGMGPASVGFSVADIGYFATIFVYS